MGATILISIGYSAVWTKLNNTPNKIYNKKPKKQYMAYCKLLYVYVGFEIALSTNLGL